MAKTRFIYTTDDKIISGATKLRPKQIPNPPPPTERFSDEENIDKVLHLEDHGLVFAVVKNGELSIGNGPAVRPIYVLYVYDPNDNILTPGSATGAFSEVFSFFPVGNGWKRLSETDGRRGEIEGSTVKVLSIHKLSKPKGPEELNVYAEQLFILANINNETVLLTLNFTTDIIQMKLIYSQTLDNSEEFFTYLDEERAADYNQDKSMHVSTHCIEIVPSRPMEELPEPGRTYANRNSPGWSATSDSAAFSTFWTLGFVLNENQLSYLTALEFQPDFTDRIVEERFRVTSRLDVYCPYKVRKIASISRPTIYFSRPISIIGSTIVRDWSTSARLSYPGVVASSAVEITVPTNRKYTTMTTSIVKLDNDSLIKKIICFDDYRRVYAICSQVTEPNNSLYRIR